MRVDRFFAGSLISLADTNVHSHLDYKMGVLNESELSDIDWELMSLVRDRRGFFCFRDEASEMKKNSRSA